MKELIKDRLKELGFKQKDLALLLNPTDPEKVYKSEKYAAHRLSLLMNGHRTASIKELKLISEFLKIKITELI